MGTSYWKNISTAVSTLLTGLKLTFRHAKDARHTHTKTAIGDKDYFAVPNGIMTVQYPHESLPVPDNGRYRLHNEIDDCIVCDKCVKICPVDCIDIDAIKATQEIGKTSDGTPKRIHAAKFDIDMGKCCFCGLCTTVCPTECLTMTKTYDFSEFDVDDHIYSFATMTPLEILQKQKELEEFQSKKSSELSAQPASPGLKPKSAMPLIKPNKAGPVIKPKTTSEDNKEAEKPVKPKPVYRPKPIIKKKKDDE